MSKSIRFLGVAIMAWAGVRAISLGMVPGVQALAFDLPSARPRVKLPPIQPTNLPAIEPVAQAAGAGQSITAGGAPVPYPTYAAYPGYLPYPVYIPVPAAAAARRESPQIIYVAPQSSEPREIHPHDAAIAPPLSLQLPELAGVAPVRQSTPSFEAPRRLPGLDRLSLTGWAMMRNNPGPDSLAGSGTLGGSEAGARLMWQATPAIAASLRASAPVNSQRGAEAALGIRYRPFRHWPVAVTLERRQGFRDYGRSAFALFAEGGLYGQQMAWGSTLDGYFQSGVVDFNNPDWFVDGQLAVSRPVWRNLSVGAGAWGGAQPGLNRLDVGPRLSIKLRNGIRTHLDYRLNVIGNAQPGSGPVVTLAGDF